MALYYKDSFKKSYKKRFEQNKNIKEQIRKRIQLFLQDPHSKLLRTHPLKGVKKGYYAFSVTGDVRIVFYIFKSNIYFVDIGTHNQVYD